MKVYILDIHHKHGNDISGYATEQEREEAIYNYVSDCWGDWFVAKEINEYTREEAINIYFEWHGEHNFNPEFYDCHDLEINSHSTASQGY